MKDRSSNSLLFVFQTTLRVSTKGTPHSKKATRNRLQESNLSFIWSLECRFVSNTLFEKSTDQPTCSWRNKSLAICTIFSTAMMLPMLWISISANMVRTRMASTRSWRYSGWGTRFRTDSTWTENLISPGVICNREKITF